MANLKDVRTELEQFNGSKTFTMGRLRDLYGKGKLGKHVRAEIAAELKDMGIGFLPSGDLPNSQDSHVRLFIETSAAGKFIRGVVGADPAYDEKIASLIDQNDEKKRKALDKILDILSDF